MQEIKDSDMSEYDSNKLQKALWEKFVQAETESNKKKRKG